MLQQLLTMLPTINAYNYITRTHVTYNICIYIYIYHCSLSLSLSLSVSVGT